MALLLVLGLAAGLPFMLVGNTLGFWLRTEGIELGAIGFLSWVGIAYSVKFLWAPVVDRTSVPLLAERPLLDGRATAYLCRQFACQQPTTDPAVFAQQARN